MYIIELKAGRFTPSIKLSRCSTSSLTSWRSSGSSNDARSSNYSSMSETEMVSTDESSTMVLECDQPGCLEIFTSELAKRQHSKIHLNAYRCLQCSMYFKTEEEFSKHEKEHFYAELELKTKRYKCQQCEETFMDEDKLKRHAEGHSKPVSPIRSQLYPCSICKAKFTDVDLRDHLIEKHANEKGFICITCQREFSSRHNLKQHCIAKNHKSYVD